MNIDCTKNVKKERYVNLGELMLKKVNPIDAFENGEAKSLLDCGDYAYNPYDFYQEYDEKKIKEERELIRGRVKYYQLETIEKTVDQIIEKRKIHATTYPKRNCWKKIILTQNM